MPENFSGMPPEEGLEDIAGVKVEATVSKPELESRRAFKEVELINLDNVQPVGEPEENTDGADTLDADDSKDA